MQGLPEPIDAMDREELAKAWLLRLVERTPLRDAGELSLSWVASEGPPLIAEILTEVTAPPEASTTGHGGGDQAAGTYSHVARLRGGPGAAELLPRDLATLQSLLIDALERRAATRDELAAAARRLAEVFGAIQAEVAATLLEQRATAAGHDELTGLPGERQLDEWIRALLAEQRRYRHPFAIALVDIEGLERVNEAYGREAGNSMLATVAGVIGRQVRSADRAFRIDQDELCIVAPHQEPEALLPMADRLAGLLTGSQLPDGPRLSITVGIAGCPRDADSVERLLDAAQEATYAAKAAGHGVATASSATRAAVQDR